MLRRRVCNTKGVVKAATYKSCTYKYTTAHTFAGWAPPSDVLLRFGAIPHEATVVILPCCEIVKSPKMDGGKEDESSAVTGVEV